ncbi:MAG: integrase family protein [Candidatus Eremiobacteraeota bacterium]|nr:integrase family protein [Candidatus Eremiobacteraeota bacterium]
MADAIVLVEPALPAEKRAYKISDGRRPTDPELIDLWLHGRPRNTVTAYRRDVRRMLDFIGVPIGAVRLVDLHAFADSLVGEPATRKRVLSATKSLLKFLATAGAIEYNVGAALRVPKGRDALADRILTKADTKKLLRSGRRPRDTALLRLLYEGGFRRGELASLRWVGVVAGEGCAYVTVVGKGSKTRTVRISSDTLAALNALRGEAADDAPVFTGRRGAALSESQVWRVVRGAAKRAGLTKPVSPHFLRHAHASHALDAGAPIALVRDTLGHSSVAVTDRYLHARPTESSGKYLRL